MPRVAVIGGGLAGLAAAHRLQRYRNLTVTLFERDTRLGGKVLTRRQGGFVMEGGPDSFLSSKARGVGLSEELGIADRLHGTVPELRRTYVVREGNLYQMPEGLSGLVPADLEPLLASPLFSDQGKERLAAERDVPRREDGDDESLAEFMVRRFGAEVYERLIEPLMAGIYAGDGRLLSILATFPQLRVLERTHGSLLAAMEAMQPAREAGRPAFLTFPTGMAELPEALARRLAGTRVAMGTGVRSLQRSAQGYTLTLDDGTRSEADAVIIAAPVAAAAALLERVSPAAAQESASIPSVSSVTVSLGYQRAQIAHDLHGYGYVVPRVEGRRVLASTWVSSKFPQRAPEQHALLRVFLGRVGMEEVVTLADDEILALAQTELRDMMGIEARPVISHIFRWPQAMPQYTLGHLERVRQLERALAEEARVRVAGNAYRGVGIPDVIASGEAAAEGVAEALDAEGMPVAR